MFIRQLEDRSGQPVLYRPDALGPKQCERLAALVAELAPDWSVDFRDDMFGRATIVIHPEGGRDADGPTLFVQGAGSSFHLEEFRWGVWRKLDDYPTWDDVLRAVRIRLIWETPFPTTLTDQRC